MPSRAKRPCARSGCAALVDSTRYCPAHTVDANQRDVWRGSPSERGYDHAWTKVRALALRRDNYLCVICLAAGRVTSALDVHHVRSIATAPELRLDLDNLVSICRPHHAIETAASNKSPQVF